MILKKIRNWAESNPYWFLIIFGIVVRIAIFLLYSGHVSIFNDSEGYLKLARFIKLWNFEDYDGGRTPGYPFLIFFAGLSENLTAIYQSILGVCTSLMLYYSFYKSSGNRKFSLFAGLIPSVFLHLLFYERGILSETLTMFMLVFCIWLLWKFNFFSKTLSLKNSLIIGLVATMAFIVRPMFMILPPFIAFSYLVLNFRVGIFHNLSRVLLFCLPLFLFHYYWSAFNETHTGYKSITSFSGINLAQNTVFFVEKANDNYADIRDIHVRKRDSLIKSNSDPAMAIWYVYEEMNKKKSITVAEFSQLLNPMNTDLITNHPQDYAIQVLHSWTNFWKTGIMWNYDSFKVKEVKWILAGFWLYIMVPIIILIKIVFLLICCYHFYIRIKKKKWIFNFEFFCVLLILGASVGQALVTFGSNARFSIPFFPFILIVVLKFYLNLNKKYVTTSLRIK